MLRMLRHMTGGRHDGQEWPPFMGLIDVPEWEAPDLVSSGNAEYPDAPVLDRGYDVLKFPDTDYESHLRREDGTEVDPDPRYVYRSEEESWKDTDSDSDNDFERDDSDNDFERKPEIKRPYTNANKQEWIDYVVESGFIGYGDAKNMTKAALIEEFG